MDALVMGRMRFGLALVVLAGVVSFIPGASASCAAATLEVSDRRVRIGDEITLRGEGWGTACNDTGTGSSGGCGRDEPRSVRPLGTPAEDITLFLRNVRTKKRHVLTTVDADHDYSIEVTARVPEVPGGRYVLVDDHGLSYFEGPAIRVR